VKPKAMLKVWLAIIFVAAALASTTALAACTREQAFNRMMALNQYG